jgi:2-polyprenyl-6-methoxyphenol hydroxylase-like FAD-dependent oxidoreductase
MRRERRAMRIAVVGGGPAGLYFAALWKGRHSRDEVHLFEQNAAHATFGFGVVFSDRALNFLREDDPDTATLIAARMQRWRDITITHRGQSIVIDGVGFSAIGRLELLQLLQQRARAAGVACAFASTIESAAELAGYDLIVAADGAHSRARRSCEAYLGTSLSHVGNKFIWYGTRKRFATLTQTFVACELGAFNAHHYPYSSSMSTFIVECDQATFVRAGFDAAGEEQARRVCEEVFSATLDGHPLQANRSQWRSFPLIWNARWSYRNMVLIGDALHTAHYSIGSGTRLALMDALALVKALESAPGDVSGALLYYQDARWAEVARLVAASRRSALWYEGFAAHMRLPPIALAMSYMRRSERVDISRLRAMSPRFMALYDRAGSAGLDGEEGGGRSDDR